MPRQRVESELHGEAQRIVTAHDKPEIEHLLITVGGPDIDGIRYPGEEILGAFVAEGPSLTIEAEHLRSVTMHLWSAAEVIEVEVSRRSGAGTNQPV